MRKGPVLAAAGGSALRWYARHAARSGAFHQPAVEVLADVPGRNSDIARAVRKLDGGTVEIKPRELKMDTDRLQRRLRGRGNAPLAILWCRLGPKQRAFICRRMP